MKLQSSYIFLKNPYNKEFQPQKEGNNVAVTVGRTVYGYMKQAFPDLTRVDDYSSLFCKEKHDGKIVCGNISGNLELIITSVAGTTYLDVSVECKTKHQCVECLEVVYNRIISSGVREKYIDIISYDAVSEYYCNKLYPELNTLERNLRKLLFNVYIVNFGKEYYSATVNVDLQDKIKKAIKVDDHRNKSELRTAYKANSNKEIEEIARLQKFFYSFEYSDIQNLLFAPGWNDMDEIKKNKFLETNKDLSELDDNELRRAFSEFTPKSDWDRFFSGKIKISNIQDIIEDIRLYRNTIAHFKFFNKEDYNDCKNKMRGLNASIKKAILITEEKDFVEKSEEALKSTFEGLYENFVDLNKLMSERVQRVAETVVQPAMRILSEYVKSNTWLTYAGRLAMNAAVSSDLSKNDRSIQVIKPSFKISDGMKLFVKISARMKSVNAALANTRSMSTIQLEDIPDEHIDCKGGEEEKHQVK